MASFAALQRGFALQIGASVALLPSHALAQRVSPTNVDALYSPNAQTFERQMRCFLQGWEQVRGYVEAQTSSEEIEVDYGYMARAASQAARLPDIHLSPADIQSLASVSTDFSEILDIDYDEE